MSYLFISHSSNNDFEALALKNWLNKQGWDDIFLDLDPQRGILAGQRWERALHEAASRCDAVLFCVSKEWLDSPWCQKEYELAQRLNKILIGLVIEDIPIQELPEELTETWQLVNLSSGNDHELLKTIHPESHEEKHVHFSAAGLTRLKSGLVKAGLNPLFYEWPPSDEPQRAPYRGMAPLDTKDAGIFFGRAAPTNELISTLKQLSGKAKPGIMAVLGASGAGKSSFIRAGVIPRLKRDESHFLTLPIIRPELSVLWGENGLLNSLTKMSDALDKKISRAAIRSCIEKATQQNDASTDLSQYSYSLHPSIQELLDIFSSYLPASEDKGSDLVPTKTPSIVIVVDQGEELFNSEGIEEAHKFLDLLALLTSQSKLPIMVVFTIRSDSFERLQTYKAFEGVTQQTFSLAPMPQGAYHSVIEGPATRLEDTKRPLKIDPALTQQLSMDIEKGGNKDALPLLAFTLERLYLEYASSGELTLDDYKQMGGIEGAIEAAVELALKAAQKNPELPNKRDALIALLHRGLIPWLAGIDPYTQSPRRRVANIKEIPQEARPVIEHLIDQRLLLTDIDQNTGETTIEPAHEALLRQWGLLKGWLKEDFATLTNVESIQRACRDWLANNKDNDWLSHNAGRLQDAENVKNRPDLAQILSSDEWNYLSACRKLEDEIKNKELNEAKKLLEIRQREAVANRKLAKRTTIGMFITFGLLLVSVFLAYQAFEGQKSLLAQQKIAESERKRAQLEADNALAVNQFIEQIFDSANPYIGGSLNIKLLEAMDENVDKIDTQFKDQPLVQANVKHSMGKIYLALQNFEKSEQLLVPAMLLRQRLLEDDDDDLLESYVSVSDLKQSQGKYQEAKDIQTQAIALKTNKTGESSLELVPLLDELVQTHLYLGEFESATKVSKRALELRKTLDGSEQSVAEGLRIYSQVESYKGNSQEARDLALQSFELLRKSNALETSLMQALNDLGIIEMNLGNFKEAETYFKEAITIAETEFGKNHGDAIVYKENLGNVMYQQGQYKQTLALLDEVLESRKQTFGERHELVGRTNANIGSINISLKNNVEAKTRLETAFSIFQESLPSNHSLLAHLLTSLAINDNALKDYQSALARLEKARPINVASFGEQSHQVGRTELVFARTYNNMGDKDEAIQWLEKSIEKLSLHSNPQHRDLLAAKKLLTQLKEQ